MNNHFFYRLLLMLFVTAATNATIAQPVNNRKEVRIESGIISGKKSAGSEVFAFKGIPFASPPVGDLRWQPPVPPAPWQGVKIVDEFGPSPMQPDPEPFMVYTSEFLIPKSPINEDCLYLNVWTEAKSPSEKRPVFVWIYGGGFSSGGTACPIYDGEALAKKGVIVVSIAYRVGPFGFFAHPELTKESPNGASGNYGFMDQIAALRWVQKNIMSFGGDPNNVTIAGQSAGSFSVNVLCASPIAKGLFHKAIAESGSVVVKNERITSPSLANGEAAGVKIAEKLNAQSIKELRKIPASEILKTAQGMGQFITDGYILPEPVPDLFAKGRFADIPLLTGWNADEAFVFEVMNKSAFQNMAAREFKNDAGIFLKHYPANTDEEAAASQIALSRDQIFGLSNYKWADIQSVRGKSKVYVYYFTRKPPATGDFVKWGAFHTAEVPYVFNNLKYFNRTFEPVDRQLAETMSDYWVNFMKTGNPNGNGLPKWPAYDSKKGEVMILGDKTVAGPLPGKAGLDFLYSAMQKK
jgi:para-nitrobenzyl esterase